MHTGNYNNALKLNVKFYFYDNHSLEAVLIQGENGGVHVMGNIITTLLFPGLFLYV